MASAIQSMKTFTGRESGSYLGEQSAQEHTINDGTFVPELPSIQRNVHKMGRMLQWRRQVSDLIGGIVSGAIAIR